MIKNIIKFFFYTSAVIILFAIYLTFIGIKTDRFNDIIKNEVLRINKKINLNLETVKILLNLKDLTFEITSLRPNLLIEGHRIPVEEIKTGVSVVPLLTNKSSIKNLNITTKEIQLNDVIFIRKSFKSSPELFLLDKIVQDGYVICEIDLNFDQYGKIKNNYEIKGFIKNAKLDFFKKIVIDNLDLLFKINKKEYYLEEIQSNFNQVKLFFPFIKIKENIKNFSIDGKILIDENLNNIHMLNSLFNNSLKEFGIERINFNSESNFSFDINKKLKVDNFKVKSEINLSNLIYNNDSLNINKYLPNFQNTIELQNNKIFIDYKKNRLKVKGKGQISIEKEVDYLEYELTKKNDKYNFKTIFNINKNVFVLDVLNYEKSKNLASVLNIIGSYKKDKKTIFSSISLVDEKKNFFKIENLNLNNKFKINSLNSLDFKFTNNNNIKNQLNLIKNNNKYKIYGKSFDASKLIDEFLDGNNDNSTSIFNNLSSTFDIKIEKTYLDQLTFVHGLETILEYKNNKIYNLDLKSIFPNNKTLNLNINTNENNEKITKISSDYPKPLIDRYKFIKGFKDGFLELNSISKNNISKTHLIIDNFKIKEVPVLAKLLSLASLQGISDILTGEGIRFTNLEMKFSKKKNLVTIDEMYAIGPALSILIDGYIDSKKLVSLRGTLVPATTINKSIASIPILGSLLIGEKAGEGVFGVSFKIKGPPSNLKTTVNPIKTLTPRFINRTLEKIKKN
jgi:hypothetical protein